MITMQEGRLLLHFDPTDQLERDIRTRPSAKSRSFRFVQFDHVFPFRFRVVDVFITQSMTNRKRKSTPAQEQCKSSRCAKHCSCLTYKPRHCYEILQNGCDSDGVYRIFPDGYRRGLEVVCDQTTDGGGWQVFQRRFNGTLDFNRKWTDYKFGFGDVDGEFWLGNEHVYNMLNMLKHKHYHPTLRVDLEDMENKTMFAEYRNFRLASAAHSYKMKLGKYSGDSGRFIHSGNVFSTADRDGNQYHLSQQMGGTGWWFQGSHFGVIGILNGPFAHTSGTSERYWNRWTNENTYLRKTEMKFRFPNVAF